MGKMPSSDLEVLRLRTETERLTLLAEITLGQLYTHYYQMYSLVSDLKTSSVVSWVGARPKE